MNNPPDKLLSWLTYRDFLTVKLKNTLGDAQLKLLNQQERPTGWWERYHLGILEQSVIVREIQMSALETPCWYARTIIPLSCYQRQSAFFAGLKETSLGHLIHNHAQVHRQDLVYYEIDPSYIEYHWLTPDLIVDNPSLWSRLSQFRFDEGESFYLFEVFLPGLLRMLP